MMRPNKKVYKIHVWLINLVVTLKPSQDLDSTQSMQATELTCQALQSTFVQITAAVAQLWELDDCFSSEGPITHTSQPWRGHTDTQV